MARTRPRFKVRKVACAGQVAPRRRRYTRPWKLPPMSGGRRVAPQGPRPRPGTQVIPGRGTDPPAGQQGNKAAARQHPRGLMPAPKTTLSFNLGVRANTLSFTTGPRHRQP